MQAAEINARQKLAELGKSSKSAEGVGPSFRFGSKAEIIGELTYFMWPFPLPTIWRTRYQVL